MNLNQDELIESVEAFESTVRSHENMGSQPLEDHAIIQEDYLNAKENLCSAVKGLTNNPAAAVIAYILDSGFESPIEDDSDAMEFLRYWNEGEFDILRRNWKNIPDEVFIGAEVGFVPGSQSQGEDE